MLQYINWKMLTLIYGLKKRKKIWKKYKKENFAITIAGPLLRSTKSRCLPARFGCLAVCVCVLAFSLSASHYPLSLFSASCCHSSYRWSSKLTAQSILSEHIYINPRIHAIIRSKCDFLHCAFRIASRIIQVVQRMSLLFIELSLSCMNFLSRLLYEISYVN